jgi:hypothetical protein
MYPYLRTYQLALTSAWALLPRFEVSQAKRVHYTIKAANLAVSFLGFSIDGGQEFLVRSADLGVLASLFDLSSDGMSFDREAVRRFQTIVQSTLDASTAQIIFDLLSRKKDGAIRVHGLERGVDALHIVLKHLRADVFWKSEADVREVGILCQVVDDVLDYENDIVRGELNFLRAGDSRVYLDKLVAWDYRKQFCNSAHPHVLFYGISKAKTRAKKWLAKSALQEVVTGRGLRNAGIDLAPR